MKESVREKELVAEILKIRGFLWEKFPDRQGEMIHDPLACLIVFGDILKGMK